MVRDRDDGLPVLHLWGVAVASTCASPSRKLFSPRESGVIGVYASATPGISPQKKRTGHLSVTLATTRSLRGFLSARMCTSLTASWMRSKRVCSSAPSGSSGMRSMCTNETKLLFPSKKNEASMAAPIATGLLAGFRPSTFFRHANAKRFNPGSGPAARRHDRPRIRASKESRSQRTRAPRSALSPAWR